MMVTVEVTQEIPVSSVFLMAVTALRLVIIARGVMLMMSVMVIVILARLTHIV